MLERYSRQLAIERIGESGQRRLLSSSVFVVGCGGLGSVLLYCLCGMGVGRVGFCDGDTVSLSNLNRQFLHRADSIGRNKAESANKTLSAFAPDIELIPHPVALTDQNAASLLSGYDAVALAVDSLPSRLVANRACVRLNTPLVDGGVDGLRGTLYTVRPHETACLNCLYQGMTPSDACVSSFAPVVSAISALQAQAISNILLGRENPSDGRLYLYDGASLALESVALKRLPDCAVCS